MANVYSRSGLENRRLCVWKYSRKPCTFYADISVKGIDTDSAKEGIIFDELCAAAMKPKHES